MKTEEPNLLLNLGYISPNEPLKLKLKSYEKPKETQVLEKFLSAFITFSLITLVIFFLYLTWKILLSLAIIIFLFTNLKLNNNYKV